MADKKPSAPSTPQQDAEAREGTMEELRYIQQMYNNQYMSLANEVNARLELLKDCETAQKTLENVSEIKDKNTMQPIGHGVFASGKITNDKTFVVAVGAGFFVEKDINGAKAFIAKEMEEEQQHLNRLGRTKRELEAALMEISYKINELSH